MPARLITKSTTVPLANFNLQSLIAGALQQIQAGSAASNVNTTPLQYTLQVDQQGNVTFTYEVATWPVGKQVDFAY